MILKEKKLLEHFTKKNCKKQIKKLKVKLDLSNYATKADLKNATGVDTSKFAKKVDLANLKSNVNKLGIDKLKNVPTNLSNLKSKVDKLDVDKLVPVPVDLRKLSDVVKKDVFKKDIYNSKIKNIEDKTPDITNLAINIFLNAKINEVKGEIYSVSNLVKKADYNTKINEIKKKITDHNHDKGITTPEFNRFTAEILDLRLKRANLASKNDIANFVNKTYFANKLKDVTSNKNE